MRTRFTAALAALLASGAVAFASEAADYTFVGTWDCEVGEFAFTADSYTPPGDETLPILEVRRDSDVDFVLVMPDGYEVGLSNVGESTMGWFSFASGDGFTCTRLP